MIKTLHITGVAVVLLAGVVLASVLVPASVFHFGGRGNKQFSRIIDEPNAVERWRNQHGTDNQSKDTTPPLVRQAETLAKIINPPEKPAPKRVNIRSANIPTKVQTVDRSFSAQFAVVGTAYSPIRPTASFAYLRMADNTYQWVQQGEQVGHLTIKDIKGDSITCWDGSRDVVMPVEPVPDTASMLTSGGTPAASAVSTAPPALAAPQPVVGKTLNRPVARPIIPSPQVATKRPMTPGTPATGSPVPQLTPQEEEVLGSLVDRIKQSESDPAAREAAIRKIIEEYRSSRITAGETEKLGNLGEKLNDRRDAAREALRREQLRRLSAPRTIKK